MQRPKKFRQKDSGVSVKNDISRGGKRVERAILKTLSYRLIFNYPLSFSQLQNYLITKKPISRRELLNALDGLVLQEKVRVIDGRYILASVSKPVDWESRAKNSTELIKKARKVSRTLERLPWINFIAITGSVAAFNAVEEDDIDILIVTQKNRLWLARGFVFLILGILGELRKDSSSNKKICPNILLDESNLSWSRKNRNIYVAHEVVMMFPIFDRGNTYLKFLEENSWVSKYFGNLKFPVSPNSENQRKHPRNILDIFESFARFLQLAYMKSKKTTEITRENIIHFNRDDHTQKLLAEFEKLKSKALK